MKSRIDLIQQICVFVLLVAFFSAFVWGLWNYPGETWAVIACFVVLLIFWQVSGEIVKGEK